MKPAITPTIRKLLLLMPILLSAAGTISWYWLLHTHSGALQLVSVGSRFLPGDISFESAKGDLGAGLTLGGLEYCLDCRHHGLGVRVPRLRLTVDADLLPPSLEVSLRVEPTLAIRQPSSRQQSAPARGSALKGFPFQGLRSVLGSLNLPIPIRIAALDVSHMAFYDDKGLAWEVHNIEASMDLGRQFQLHALRLEVMGQSWSAEGRLVPTPPFDSAFKLVGAVTGLAGLQPAKVSKITAKVSGQLDRSLDLTGSLDYPHILLSGNISAIFEALQWDLEVRAEFEADDLQALALPGWLPIQPPLSARVNSRGTLQQFTLDVTSQIRSEALDTVALDIRANGYEGGISLGDVSLISPLIELRGVGEVSWEDALAASFEFELGKLELAALPPAWMPEPGELTMGGRLRLHWSENKAQLESLEMRIPGTDIGLQAAGIFDPAAGITEAQISWAGLGWPLLTTHPQVSSPVGSLRLTGSPQDWALSVRAIAKTGYLPEGHIVMAGHGNRSSAQIDLQQGQLLGGDVTGQVQIDWRDTLSLQANLTADNLDIGALNSAWPSQLNSRLAIDLVFPGAMDGTMRMALQLKSLSGSLRNQTPAGAGRLVLHDAQLEFDRLSLTAGDSAVALHGNMAAPDGLEFSFHADALEDLLTDAQGSVSGSGRIKFMNGGLNGGMNGLGNGATHGLMEGWPRVEAEIQGSELRWHDASVRQLAITTSVADSGNSGDFDGTVTRLVATLDDLSLSGQHIQAVQLSLDGDRFQQRLGLTVHGSEASLRAGVSGSLADGGGERKRSLDRRTDRFQRKARWSRTDDALRTGGAGCARRSGPDGTGLFQRCGGTAASADASGQCSGSRTICVSCDLPRRELVQAHTFIGVC